MIGKLKGVIDSYGEDAVILDVNGVGYLVHCSARTLQELPRVGGVVRGRRGLWQQDADHHADLRYCFLASTPPRLSLVIV